MRLYTFLHLASFAWHDELNFISFEAGVSSFSFLLQSSMPPCSCSTVCLLIDHLSLVLSDNEYSHYKHLRVDLCVNINFHFSCVNTKCNWSGIVGSYGMFRLWYVYIYKENYIFLRRLFLIRKL